MAKGLRSSSKKSNKTKLRARVFGPVEAARTERLSAKLLELAQQPKPARGEMDLDADAEEDKGVYQEALTPFLLSKILTDTGFAETQAASDKDQAAAEEEAEGWSPRRSSFSYPVPAGLCCSRSNNDSSSCSEGEGDEEEQQQLCRDNSSVIHHDGNDELFYTLLGLSSEITGFDAWGDLQMTFEH
jgi:hypothetical protein